MEALLRLFLWVFSIIMRIQNLGEQAVPWDGSRNCGRLKRNTKMDKETRKENYRHFPCMQCWVMFKVKRNPNFLFHWKGESNWSHITRFTPKSFEWFRLKTSSRMPWWLSCLTELKIFISIHFLAYVYIFFITFKINTALEPDCVVYD